MNCPNCFTPLWNTSGSYYCHTCNYNLPSPWPTVKKRYDGLYYADVPVNISHASDSVMHGLKSYIQVALEGPMEELGKLRLEIQELKIQLEIVRATYKQAVENGVAKELSRIQREKLGQREVIEDDDATDKRYKLLEIDL